MHNTTTPTDVQSLIGQTLTTDQLHQQRERELFDSTTDFDGYDEWSEDLDELPFTEGDLENFTVRGGKLYERATPPKSNGRIGGIEW